MYLYNNHTQKKKIPRLEGTKDDQSFAWGFVCVHGGENINNAVYFAELWRTVRRRGAIL